MDQIASMLPQLIMDGLTLGFVYAIVALGYTMVYGILEFINFAHSEIFMFGAFAGTEVLLFLENRGILTGMSPVVALLLSILFAMLLSGTLGVFVERIAYKPLRSAPKLVPFISAIGVSFFLQDFVRLVEGLWKNAFYLSTPVLFTREFVLPNGVKIPEKVIYIMAIALLIMLGLHLFVTRHKWGKAMRACAQDRSTAELMGINVNRVISLTFLIGAGMGGAAGTLFSVQYALIHPYVGYILGMKAFTAAVFGGIGSIPGAMLGGIVLGLLEVLGAATLGALTNGVFGSEYKDVFAFLVLILVLIFKPSGLLGKQVGEKV